MWDQQKRVPISSVCCVHLSMDLGVGRCEVCGIGDVETADLSLAGMESYKPK